MHELMITTPVEFKTYCENIVQQKKQDHERMLKKEKDITHILKTLETPSEKNMKNMLNYTFKQMLKKELC